MTIEAERIYRMSRLRDMLASEGWALLRHEINNRIQAGIEELGKLMDKTPEKLTGRAAFRAWAKHKELTDLMDWINDEVKLGERASEVLSK